MTISRNMEGKNGEFWELAKQDRETVEAWPEWKRNLPVTKYSEGIPQGKSCESCIESQLVTGECLLYRALRGWMFRFEKDAQERIWKAIATECHSYNRMR